MLYFIVFPFRKDFRPAYQKLSLLGTFFPEAPVLALTATATLLYRNEIKNSLNMRKTITVEANPNRENIYYSVLRRGNNGDDKLFNIIKPFAEELKEKLIKTPLTIVYSNLETCGECYSFFEQELGEHQYYPTGSLPCFTNRLFAQYHAQYPEEYRNSLVKGLISGTTVARVLFVTVAFGVGIDVSSVERVVHIGVPYTMEEFFQETGRAGRNGKQAESVLYYNSYDISRGKKSLQNIMREYCTTQGCRRKAILCHFGSSLLSQHDKQHNCCDNCKRACKCEDCSKHEDSGESEMFCEPCPPARSDSQQ